MSIVIPKITIGKQNDDMLSKEHLLIARHMGLFNPVMEYFKKNVIINYQHGEEMDNPNAGDAIVVNLWSANKHTEIDFPMDDTAFGFKYCTDAVFKQNDDTIGYGDKVTLIQWNPNVKKIDFLYDVCEFKSEDEINLMKKLTLELLYLIAGSKEAFDTSVAEFKAYLQQLKCNALVDSIMSQEIRRNEQRKQRIVTNSEKVEALRRETRMLIVAIENDKGIVEGGKSALTGLKERILKEFDVILSNSKVIGIDVNEKGLLNIFTKILYANVLCDDKKVRRYLIGRFRIMVNIATGKVCFYNLDKSNTRYGLWSKNDMAPHVNGQTASGCLGSASALIADTIDQFQWGALADILINYLESVNINDGAGKLFYRWQEVDKDNIPIPKADRYVPHYGSRNSYMEPIMNNDEYNPGALLENTFNTDFTTEFAELVTDDLAEAEDAEATEEYDDGDDD